MANATTAPYKTTVIHSSQREPISSREAPSPEIRCSLESATPLNWACGSATCSNSTRISPPPVTKQDARQIVHSRCDPAVGLIRDSSAICNRRIVVQCYFSSSRIKDRYMHEIHLMRHKASRGSQNAQAISHAASKIDGGSFLKVFRRARYLSNAEAEHHSLGNHLIVEHKVVRVFEQRQSLQQLSRKCAEPRVVLG